MSGCALVRTCLYFRNPRELANPLEKRRLLVPGGYLVRESYRTVLGNDTSTRIDQSEIAKQCGANRELSGRLASKSYGLR